MTGPGRSPDRKPGAGESRLRAVMSGGRWVVEQAGAGRESGVRAPALAGVLALVLLAAALAAWAWWRGQPREEPLPAVSMSASSPARPRSPAGSGGGGPGQTATPGVGMLVVHVVGKVHRPGVVRLPPGSRVADAVEAAGGLLPGVAPASVNLARPVSDGEQVAVGVSPAPDSVPGGSGGGTASGAGGGTGSVGPVDLNTATADQLEQLPGVGPVLAQRILDWRAQHGRFSSVDELREVTGIGERKFAEIAPKVRV